MTRKTPSRRAVMGALAAAGAATGGASPATAAPRPSLMQDITTFVSLGEHRCGTEAEARTAQWLADRLGALGYATETVPFPVRTFREPGGVLSAGGLEIAAFPQWRAPEAALGRPVVGELRDLPRAAPGCVALAAQPFRANAYWQPAQQQAAFQAHSAGAAALVIAMAEPTDQIYACNQEASADLPLPVAIIAPSQLARVVALGGVQARLELRGVPIDTQGLYVTAHRPGQGEAIIVSTPLTGWFRCGAERGPGVALLLRLAGDLAASRRPVWLVATGAHELGHMGMKRALASGRLPRPDQAALWIHLGAGIGAQALDARYGVASPRALTLSPDLEPLVRERLPVADWLRVVPGPTAPGEAGDVAAAGYPRMLGLAGGFPGFHTPGDDGHAVDPDRLSSIADGLTTLVSRI